MASKQSRSTSTFIVKEQGTIPQQQNTVHGNSDVITSSTSNPVLLQAVPKYVTDVGDLISVSVESRRMFLTEETRTCLEAAKKDRNSHQMTST